jgi:predicted O-linked N-acetylglucosamine transferase (SPINDLY family)/SAM-dependent methyltransferase
MENFLRDDRLSLADAAEALGRAVRLEPHNAQAWAQLGDLHLSQERPVEASNCLRQALTIEPRRPDLHASLGAALLDSGDLPGARASCARALGLDSRCVGALVTLGNVSIAEQRLEEALDCFRTALSCDPGCQAARPNIASTLYMLGRHAEALEAFQETLRFEPGNPLAQHMVAALGGAVAQAAPREYVRELFDRYAATFDHHLVDSLGYKTPELIVGLVREVRAVVPGSLDVLDLGCGTGLAGVAIHPWSRRLVGVDLAPRMLEVAARRGVYGQLRCGDLLEALQSEPAASFDVVLAADVLVYVGRLESIVAEVRRVLRPDGIFAFSVEQPESRSQSGTSGPHDYEVSVTGRYAHSIDYLQRLSTSVHFTIGRQVECSLRTEQGRPVAGMIAAWIASPQPTAGKPEARSESVTPAGVEHAPSEATGGNHAMLTIPQAIQQATDSYGRGEWDKAEQLCRWILGTQADHFAALSVLGVIAAQTQRVGEAASLLGRAVAANPGDATAHMNYGSVLKDLGRHQEALDACDRALRINPDYADAHFNRGNTLRDLTREEEALESYQRALRIKPDYTVALYNLGITLQGLKRYEEALDSYARVLRLAPEFPQAYVCRGNVLQDLKRPHEALESYDRALRIKPDDADTYNNRGIVLEDLRRYDEALESYERALAVRPDHPEAYNNRGSVLQGLKRYDEALNNYERALQIRPEYAEAYNNRGNALQELERYEEALDSYELALQTQPDYDWLYGQWLLTRMRLCEWGDWDSHAKELLSEVTQAKKVASPYVVVALTDSLSVQRKAADIWVNELCPPLPSAPFKRYEHERPRIAYLSGDFRDHPVSQLLVGVLERHDRERFETIAVALQPPGGSALSQRIRAAVDRFLDVSQQSDEAVASTLRQMEVDILVDLQGFTQGMRAQILARRAAPVQVNYLGFPATMGAPYIDYIIGDQVVIPEGAEVEYSERVVRLPQCMLPFDNRQEITANTPSRSEAGLPSTGFVFCAFNNHVKITPVVFDVWMRLLQATPESCLWLRWAGDSVVRNLRREAQARGVEAERIVFAPKVPALEDHLARQRLADLFLDTLPYNAHATAAQALWSGVPVLTCQGATFAGRVAGSLLQSVGLPDLIAQSLPEYEQKGLELARHPERLASIRERLARNRDTAPLFDTEGYCRRLEAIYAQMIERQRRGE